MRTIPVAYNFETLTCDPPGPAVAVNYTALPLRVRAAVIDASFEESRRMAVFVLEEDGLLVIVNADLEDYGLQAELVYQGFALVLGCKIARKEEKIK